MNRKTRILLYTLIMGLLVFSNSCEKDETKKDDPKSVPVLTTNAVTNITLSNATSGGNISDNGVSEISARGVCWSTNQIPTIEDQKTTDAVGNGILFTSSITYLKPGTTYYVRAYATNSAGTGYGTAVSFKTKEGVKDANGNVYSTVTIGKQIWMAENLKTTKYSDGTDISLKTDKSLWIALTSPAYCWYNNDKEANGNTYGALYNWYAVDTKKLCPTGWHVPTDNEWTILKNELGGEVIAGSKLKETGTTHWRVNEGATNETGFTALPGGARNSKGEFIEIKDKGYWWSSTVSPFDDAWLSYLFGTTGYLYRGTGYRIFSGHSVRCIKG